MATPINALQHQRAGSNLPTHPPLPPLSALLPDIIPSKFSQSRTTIHFHDSVFSEASLSPNLPKALRTSGVDSLPLIKRSSWLPVIEPHQSREVATRSGQQVLYYQRLARQVPLPRFSAWSHHHQMEVTADCRRSAQHLVAHHEAMAWSPASQLRRTCSAALEGVEVEVQSPGTISTFAETRSRAATKYHAFRKSLTGLGGLERLSRRVEVDRISHQTDVVHRVSKTLAKGHVNREGKRPFNASVAIAKHFESRVKYLRRSQSCNATNTPEWRRGPYGCGTLCNACGLNYARLKRK